MTCVRCRHDIDVDSLYCRFCGAAQQGASASGRLSRRPNDGRVAGICAGLADYFNADPTLVRLAWIVLSIVPGAVVGGLLAYLAAWMILPVSTLPVLSTTPRLRRPLAERKVAGVCAGLARYFDVDVTAVRLLWVILSIYPGAVICGLIAYTIAWFVIPSEPHAPFEPAPQPL